MPARRIAVSVNRVRNLLDATSGILQVTKPPLCTESRLVAFACTRLRWECGRLAWYRELLERAAVESNWIQRHGERPQLLAIVCSW